MIGQFYGRPLDRAESFFWFLDRLSSTNFSVIAEGHGPLAPDDVQAALDRAQARHSLLAASVETNAEHLLRFAARPATGIALQCLDLDGWHDRLAELNIQPFGVGEYPLMRAYLFASGDGHWVFALVFHHSISDARSGFHLLNEVLRDAVETWVGFSAVAPRSPLTELYPAKYYGELAQRAGEQMRASRIALLNDIGPPETYRGHRSSQEAPAPRLVPLRLPREQVKALLHRARQEQATINGLVGAAQLIALRQLFGDSEAHTLGLTCAADLRPYLRTPIDASTPGLGATLVSSLHRVRASEKTWHLARRVTTAIRQQIQAGAGHLFYHAMPPTERMPATAEGIEAFRGLMASRPSSSLLSNVGQLPPLPNLPGLRLKALSFALCPTEVQPLFTAVTGHADGLAINLNHNVRQFAQDVADAVARSMQGLLFEAALTA